MRISDWSSDVCSSDLLDCAQGCQRRVRRDLRDRQVADNRISFFEHPPDLVDRDQRQSIALALYQPFLRHQLESGRCRMPGRDPRALLLDGRIHSGGNLLAGLVPLRTGGGETDGRPFRSEEHTSELPSLMRISYAVFCLKKKQINNKT